LRDGSAEKFHRDPTVGPPQDLDQRSKMEEVAQLRGSDAGSLYTNIKLLSMVLWPPDAPNKLPKDSENTLDRVINRNR